VLPPGIVIHPCCRFAHSTVCSADRPLPDSAAGSPQQVGEASAAAKHRDVPAEWDAGWHAKEVHIPHAYAQGVPFFRFPRPAPTCSASMQTSD